MDDLDKVINEFVTNVNSNNMVKRLIEGWQPNIVIESDNTAHAYTLLVRKNEVVDILHCHQDGSHVVHIQADHEVLAEVFSGRRNAANAFLDSDLNIFSSEKDQVKLDAIALLVWGM